MWCKHCRQDVKGVRSPDQIGANCARCGSLLEADEQSARPEVAGVARSAAHGIDLCQEPPIHRGSTFEDWELDERFRRVQTRVGRWKHHEAQAAPQTAASQTTPPSRQPTWHMHQRHSVPPKRHARPSRRTDHSPLAARMIIGLSLLATATGAAFLGSSTWLDRGELWSPGIATIVAGQIGLLAGLTLRLERVWQNGRDAVRKLDQVDLQLHRLEQTTKLMCVSHGSAAQAFYAHMADDANPQVLVADLKGQLDLLARSVARRWA
jgi:hypothetical protein